MKKERVQIPSRTRVAVLREFNHRCAMCGEDGPQIHHIDEDPTNNDPQNLLPLCPNCHLRDQHDPTAHFDSGKLALFRKYRDPLILSPQFHPIWKRLRCLYSIDEKVWANRMESEVSELIAFVRSLKMGAFYGDGLWRLLGDPARAMLVAASESGGGLAENLEQMKAELIAKLRENREAAEALVIELLRYQDWTSSGGVGRKRHNVNNAS